MSKVKHIKLKLVPINFKKLKRGDTLYDLVIGDVEVVEINRKDKTFRLRKKGISRASPALFDQDGYIVSISATRRTAILPLIYKEVTGVITSNKKEKRCLDTM